MNKQVSKEQQQSSLAVTQQASTDQHFFEWKLDSLNSTTTVQIWPKGKFKFSQEFGFEGEAEKVLLTGTLQKSATGLKLKDSTGSTQIGIKSEFSEKKEARAANKSTVKTERPAFWLLIGLAVLVLAAVLIYKFLKS
ncbi:hypothetical protein LPB86_06695 [Pedobacter sp. MC2016-14]|uniref:hypothetical protein n=1 Tax=Pedobacter sp. MC2016-14 TaxID=2897327 RepID=UPI001E306986|nr:hypothetical protein [Pedobacter sp. MC2016-14]MCD0487909.1 hypothetical protein [Pedobacter sp. MC2016-14]